MKTGKASWTAEITAVFRAFESIHPEEERLFQDIYASDFLRPSFRLILKSRFFSQFMIWLMIDRRFKGASATTISRIRAVDDCIKKAILEGIEQVVILGAGYDSRAYRLQELNDRLIFEVDHPATQKLKIKKVKKVFGSIPSDVIYVSVDFEKEKLIPNLVEEGFNKDSKTLFIWEGVCKYLSSEAVDQLLTAISTECCKGSVIVFDYLFQSMVKGEVQSELMKKALRFQEKKKEPFIFGLPEDRPEEFILAKGFSSVINISADEIREQFSAVRNHFNDIHPFWGIIRATI